MISAFNLNKQIMLILMENFEIVVGQFNKNNKNKKIQYKIKISLHKKDLIF